MPTVVLKLIAGQGTGADWWTDWRTNRRTMGDFMLPPLGSIKMGCTYIWHSW